MEARLFPQGYQAHIGPVEWTSTPANLFSAEPADRDSRLPVSYPPASHCKVELVILAQTSANPLLPTHYDKVSRNAAHERPGRPVLPS